MGFLCASMLHPVVSPSVLVVKPPSVAMSIHPSMHPPTHPPIRQFIHPPMHSCARQDFLFAYRAGIEGVAASDVMRAAAAHLHPQRQAAVVVADAATAAPALRAAGFEVQRLALLQD
jgi:hypothetical protein